MSRRLLLAAAALAALLPVAPVIAQDEAHRHEGFLFNVRTRPALNDDLVYAVYQPDPANPSGLLVQRGRGYTGQAPTVDLTAAQCPALRSAIASLADLPLPAVALEAERHDIRAPGGQEYVFQGFVRFPNGGEGQVSFWAYDVPGRTPDRHLAWMRNLVRAFDTCRPRAR